jgi:hypothetical protein
MRTVIGYFDRLDRAEAAGEALVRERFPRDDISIIANETSTSSGATSTRVVTEKDGVSAGATTGAVMGGAFGVALGLGALVIPGIGPVLAAGPLAAALAGGAAGAAAGGVAGGLVGALVDAGVPREHAEHYAEGIRRGGAILTISGLSDAEVTLAERILEDADAQNIIERATKWRTADDYGTTGDTRP